MNQKPVKVQSVMRALQLLEALMRSNVPLSAMELSQLTDLNRSTVHSLLDTLITCGYVQRESSYGKYLPTIKMYALSRVYAVRTPFVRNCEPIISTLAVKYDISLNLGALTEDNTLFIIKEFMPSDHQGRTSSYMVPFHASSLGKVFLAFLPPLRTELILSELKMDPLTQYTIRDKETLLKDVDSVRQRGYAVVRDEFSYGYTSYGFPVFNADRSIAGSFSYTCSTERAISLPPSFLDEALQASRDCSLEMGCLNPPVFFPVENPS